VWIGVGNAQRLQRANRHAALRRSGGAAGKLRVGRGLLHSRWRNGAGAQQKRDDNRVAWHAPVIAHPPEEGCTYQSPNRVTKKSQVAKHRRSLPNVREFRRKSLRPSRPECYRMDRGGAFSTVAGVWLCV